MLGEELDFLAKELIQKIKNMDLYSIVIWITVFLGWLIYKKITKNVHHFEKQGIVYEKPLPIFGNMWKLMLQKESFIDFIHRYYTKFKHEQ